MADPKLNPFHVPDWRPGERTYSQYRQMRSQAARALFQQEMIWLDRLEQQNKLLQDYLLQKYLVRPARLHFVNQWGVSFDIETRPLDNNAWWHCDVCGEVYSNDERLADPMICHNTDECKKSLILPFIEDVE